MAPPGLPVPPKGPPPGSGIPAKVQTVPPNQTLYVRGLPSSKIQKEDLRTALYMLFSTYGPVLDVVALKTDKMRGQAHVVYRDIQTATQAMRSLDGSSFLGQEMKVHYAKSKSNVIAKLDGTFRMPNTASAANVEVTELQQSIFNAPVPGSAAQSSLPSKPQAVDRVMEDAGTPESRGQKRAREEEEEEEEDSDVAMEEDSDDE